MREVIEKERTIASVAASYDLVAQAVGNWVARHKKENATNQDRKKASGSAEIAKLKAEVREPRQENEFLKQTIPDGLEKIQTLAKTLISRSQDVQAYFDRPRTSNGPTEAINGCLEYLRGIALGFRTLTHYTIRSLIHIGRLKDHLTTTT